jgi:hypothetical protein
VGALDPGTAYGRAAVDYVRTGVRSGDAWHLEPATERLSLAERSLAERGVAGASLDAPPAPRGGIQP